MICNAYPSYGSLYRNGFIHRRVKGYQEQGVTVEVFYNHQPVGTPYTYEYDDVKVTVGNDEALEAVVSESSFDIYLVHFAEPSRITPLRRARVSQPVVVWIHGFEAEAWYRRWFNFLDSPGQARELLERREKYFSTQNEFFHDLANDQSLDVHFVNVSEWFRTMIVEPDNRVDMSDSVTIHNFIDTDLFKYEEKTTSDRLSILSIRPFASYKYANDQTVEAICELSKRPFFNELEFTVCGEGRYFPETVAPLRSFSNVKLVNKFLSQTEVYKLHREHGVFLAPTRFDSQGVSMCEAMSSGLVPVSTATAAIPEFVDDRCSGLLAAEEHSVGLADAIEELYFDPEFFQELSSSASVAIQNKCGKTATIDKEIELMRELVESIG